MDTVPPVTLSGMADTARVRMIFDCPERLRRAIKIRAAKSGKSASEVIQTTLERELEAELSEADDALSAGDEPPVTKRGRRKDH